MITVKSEEELQSALVRARTESSEILVDFDLCYFNGSLVAKGSIITSGRLLQEIQLKNLKIEVGRLEKELVSDE
jgi:hypothetical protein